MAEPDDDRDDADVPFDVDPTAARRHETLGRQAAFETAFLKTHPAYRHRLHIVGNNDQVVASYVMDDPETLN